MDVAKLPVSVLPSNQPETASVKERLMGEIAAAAVPALDRADIRALDISGGLQILLAETRAAFDLIVEPIAASSGGHSAGVGTADTVASNPVQAALQIVELLLQTLPDDAKDAAAWTAMLARADSALELGLEQTMITINNWRDVSPEVVGAARESVGLVLQALSEERPNPLWLRPEWVGLAPRLERLWRRRRASRRRLTDPDHWRGSLDDYDDQRR